ncbi:MAG: GNAT family N-acetyltransferase [Candidatus Nanopelagicales bacterium]
MDVLLTTERLTLRRFTSDDVDLLVELDSDPTVMRYINGGDPTPREEINDEILPAWLAHYEKWDRQGFFAAEVDGEFVGWFHLRPAMHTHVDEEGVLELGYRLQRSAWGHGYATEGSRALIDLAFRELGVDLVVADTMAVNTSSRRVMEKSGLRYIRTFHADWPVSIPGDEHGDVEYAITRAEWQGNRPV